MQVEVSKERLQTLIDKVYSKTQSTHVRVRTLDMAPDVRESYILGYYWYLEEKGLISRQERELLDCLNFTYRIYNILSFGGKFYLDEDDILNMKKLEEIAEHVGEKED